MHNQKVMEQLQLKRGLGDGQDPCAGWEEEHSSIPAFQVLERALISLQRQPELTQWPGFATHSWPHLDPLLSAEI